jgi:hypothetical protein
MSMRCELFLAPHGTCTPITYLRSHVATVELIDVDKEHMLGWGRVLRRQRAPYQVREGSSQGVARVVARMRCESNFCK